MRALAPPLHPAAISLSTVIDAAAGFPICHFPLIPSFRFGLGLPTHKRRRPQDADRAEQVQGEKVPVVGDDSFGTGCIAVKREAV
jgi:hypothetical protein